MIHKQEPIKFEPEITRRPTHTAGVVHTSKSHLSYHTLGLITYTNSCRMSMVHIEDYFKIGCELYGYINPPAGVQIYYKKGQGQFGEKLQTNNLPFINNKK